MGRPSLAGVEVITDPASCPNPPNGTVVTIGVYDGVHLGHRALIGRVRAMANELGAASAVVTFDRHPATVVRPESAPLLLTDLDQRIELLAGTGVDYTLVIHFDRERASESAEDFVREILVGCLGARAVVVGHDFHFGRNRGGNVPMLQEMGAELGFDVLGINLVADDDPAARSGRRSTRIRSLLGEGDVAGAALLLGRPHEVRGTVQHGDERGRELGFPTANVAVPADVLLPGRRHLRRLVRTAPTAPSTPPPCRSAAAPRSTRTPTSACSSATSSTSTATSTTSRPRSASCNGCEARRSSTPSKRSSSR